LVIVVAGIVMLTVVTMVSALRDNKVETTIASQQQDDSIITNHFETFIGQYNPRMPEEEIHEIVDAVMESAQQHQIEPQLLMALIAAESGFRRYAVSSRGARGLTQIMPDKCEQDWTDIRFNVARGSSYLKEQLDRFSSVSTALAAYNAGPSRARKGPDYYPRETRLYIKKVLRIYEELLQTTKKSEETADAVSSLFFDMEMCTTTIIYLN
jgi:hypothetical protein